MTVGPQPGGESTAASGLLMAYDAWNRLAKVIRDDGEDAGAGVSPGNGQVDAQDTLIAEYEYDGLGRRIVKHYDSDGSGGADTYRHFFYDGWLGVSEVEPQVVETRSSASSGEPESFQPEYQYVWSERYIDAPVCRDENTDSDGDCDDARLYYLTDANFNVTAMVDEAGTVQERYAYDPYGRVRFFDASWTSRSGSAHDVSVLYCGYYRDDETGLFHVRHRTYHPTLGRWLQRDPLGYVDGMSLYEYVRSRPLTGLDPMGLGFWGNVGAFFEGAGEAVVGAATGTAKFAGNTAVGAYDTGRLAYGAAVWAGTGDSTTLAEMETSDRRADPNYKPEWARKAEETYEETGSLGLAAADVLIEGGKAVPVAGTGIRLGENISDAFMCGRWTEENSRRLGEAAGETAFIYAVMRANSALRGRGGARPAAPKQGLTTPRRYFAGRTAPQAKAALRGKYGPPRSIRPGARTYYNARSARSYNVHQEAGHQAGRPHVDIKARGQQGYRQYPLQE